MAFTPGVWRKFDKTLKLWMIDQKLFLGTKTENIMHFHLFLLVQSKQHCSIGYKS